MNGYQKYFSSGSDTVEISTIKYFWLIDFKVIKPLDDTIS